MELITKIIPPTKNHLATVIFFHGSGDTGHNLVEWIRILLNRDMQFPHIKLIFPTAPVQPYTPLNGADSNVWFDRDSISIEAKENTKSLLKIYEPIKQLIQNEINDGIPVQKILIGGFSMGGALAMHTGYHLNSNLAGIFACSSFLNRDSIVYKTLQESKDNENRNLPELLMFHGDRDSLVPIEWGERTYDNLKNLKIKGDFIRLKNTYHELKKQEILLLEEWITKKLTINDKNKL